MDDRLTFHVTGPFTVRAPDGAPLTGLSRRAQALLAYLALTKGHRAERARLADLLWSDRSEEQARASLRQELSVLRRQLPDGILDADRQQVWLDPDRIDVERGEGDILEGFDLRSEGFEDWLRDARARSSENVPAPALAGSRSGRPVLAVLPFEGREGPEGIFVDGIVEEITGALSRVDEFDVIARQSAFSLEPHVDPRSAAKLLGADYLVEGSVRRADERVRISIHLVAGESGLTLWSERFDDRIDDLFDLQDRIAGKVAGQIQPSVRTAEIARSRTKPPDDRTAYELVLSAYPHFWSHRKEGNRRALAYYDDALSRDPDYALARAMKAWCHAQEAAYIWTDDPASERAKATEHAERAAQTSGTHAPTLVAICAAISLTSERQERAKTYIDRALSIDANSAWGWLRSAWLHCLFNRPEIALEQFARAEKLSPLDPFMFNIQFGKANAHAELGNLDEAIRLVRSGLDMAPGVEWAYRMLAAYHGMKGDEAGAADAVKRLLRHYPGMTISKMKAAMPPSILLTQKTYFEGMRRAGIPEK